MKRHSLDVLSLLFGLLFVALAAVGLNDRLTLSVIDVRWIGPGLLVAFGVALVLTAGRSRRVPQDATAIARNVAEPPVAGPEDGAAGVASPGDTGDTGAAASPAVGGDAAGGSGEGAADPDGPTDTSRDT